MKPRGTTVLREQYFTYNGNTQTYTYTHTHTHRHAHTHTHTLAHRRTTGHQDLLQTSMSSIADTEIQGDKEAEWKTNRRQRQTDRETDRQRARHTQRESHLGLTQCQYRSCEGKVRVLFVEQRACLHDRLKMFEERLP